MTTFTCIGQRTVSVAALRGIVYALPVNVTGMGMHECYIQILNLCMGVCAGMVT